MPTELSWPVKVEIRNRYLPNKSRNDYYLNQVAQHSIEANCDYPNCIGMKSVETMLLASFNRHTK